MPKHVSFETPVDWRQWKLDQAIRSLRMWVDGEGDLYAVPVVVVDPTGNKSAADGLTRGAGWWERVNIGGFAGVIPIHATTAELTSYLVGAQLDYENCSLAVAALWGYSLRGVGPPATAYRWSHYAWLDVNPAFRPSLVVPFGTSPIPFPGGIEAVIPGATVGNVELTVWGYDA